MLLKDMLVYQEGEDKGNEQTPGNEEKKKKHKRKIRQIDTVISYKF